VQTAGYDHNDFTDVNKAKADEQLLVRFFVKPWKDAAKSAEAGRPIFTEREYIDIKAPGDREGVCRPASNVDIRRFPRHYDAFKQRISGEIDEGTPLSEWSGISRSQIEELAFFNVKTVEQLLAMSDVNAGQFMGMGNLRRTAKEWLDQATEMKKAGDLQAALSKRDEEIEELKAAVKALQAAPAKRVTKKKTARKKVVAKKR